MYPTMAVPAQLKCLGIKGVPLKHTSAEETSLILVTVMNVSYRFDTAPLVIAKITYLQKIEL